MFTIAHQPHNHANIDKINKNRTDMKSLASLTWKWLEQTSTLNSGARQLKEQLKELEKLKEQ